MTLDEFQKGSIKLVPEERRGISCYNWCPNGLNESAGKIDRLLLNASFQGESLLTEEKANQISEHLGYTLWFCASLADSMGIRLDDIAEKHLRMMQEMLKNREER